MYLEVSNEGREEGMNTHLCSLRVFIANEALQRGRKRFYISNTFDFVKEWIPPSNLEPLTSELQELSVDPS